MPSGTSGTNGSVPTSGALAVSKFYGTSKGFTFNDTLSGDVNNYSLHDRAVSGGWNGTVALFANIIVPSGKVVGSSSSSLTSFIIESLPSGSTVHLENDGYIVGYGGDGGTAGTGGGAGGPGGNGGRAMSISYAVTIDNTNGIIGGGGGGGGGGDSEAADPDEGFPGVAGGTGGNGAGRNTNVRAFGPNGFAATITTGGAGSTPTQQGTSGGNLGGDGVDGDQVHGSAGAAIAGYGNISWAGGSGNVYGATS